MTTLGNRSGGFWYTFSDRTIAWSEPPVILSTCDGGVPPGYVTPPEGAPFPPTGHARIGDDQNDWWYREFQAGGEAYWGAGFGMNFVTTPPDGGNFVPFNDCPGGAVLPDGSAAIFDVDAIDSGTVGLPLAFDASQYTGVEFWVASFGVATPFKLTVTIDDDQTSPWGGICDACVKTASLSGPFMCSNSWAFNILVTPTWTQYQMPFAKMKPDSNWNAQSLKVGQIHTNRLYNLNWLFSVAFPGANHFCETSAFDTSLRAVDVGVAHIRFYQ